MLSNKISNEELEKLCADYVDKCFEIEDKFKIGDIPFGWYDRGLFPDSSYGLFRKFLTSGKEFNSSFNFGYLELLLGLIKNCIKLFIPTQLTQYINSAITERVKGKTLVFFCDIPSGNSIDSMNSFIGRREEYIDKIQGAANITILVNFDYGLDEKEKKIIIDNLNDRFGTRYVIDVRREINLWQELKNYFKSLVCLFKNYRLLFANLSTPTGVIEHYFLSEIKKISSSKILYYLNQQDGYKNIFGSIENGSFIQTYSFLQIDRIPTYFANRAKLTTISIGDRLYTLKRPSNRPRGRKHIANPECLPNKYLVNEIISKNTLCECQISSEQISVFNKKGQRNFNDEQKNEAILVYLQRSKDNPVDLVESVFKSVEDSDIEIVLKLHPRYLDVKEDLKNITVSSNKITFVNLGSVPSKKYLAATTVFSTAGLEAIESNIPVVWAPFLSLDSLFVSEMFDTVGLNTSSKNEHREKLKKLCHNKAFNKSIRERQKKEAIKFWDRANAQPIQDYLINN